MKILSLFSGIGAFEKALDNLEIPYELIAYCEIDKYASKSYAAIHNVDESMNLGDITKVNEKELPKDIDLITYGFPCQDISLAGKQKGFFNEDGTQTRSGLFFEALRIIKQFRQGNRIYDSNAIAMCLLASSVGNAGGYSYLYGVGDKEMNDLRIRKLTPKECWRLMGFSDSDFEKAEKVNSNTQLYKQAGNSIVVPVVEYIIKALLDCGALEK